MSRLHVDSVIKRFGSKQLLTDVFISCERGEIIGLLGRNGTGKSSLLKIVFGSLAAENKFVRVDEKILTRLFDSRRLIKYLPQDSFLPSHVNVQTIIDLFSDQFNACLIKDHDLIKPLLKMKSNQLSGGERRILEILLIVLSDASFTFIDEPFNGVAPLYKEEIKNLIKEHSKTKGFIITDHDYRNVLDIATRIIIIHDGATKEIKSQDELKYWGYIPA